MTQKYVHKQKKATTKKDFKEIVDILLSAPYLKNKNGCVNRHWTKPTPPPSSLIWVCPPITIRILEEEIDHVLLTWRDNSSSIFLLQDIVRQTNTHKSFSKMTYFLTWATRLNLLVIFYTIDLLGIYRQIKLWIYAVFKYFVKSIYTFVCFSI